MIAGERRFQEKLARVSDDNNAKHDTNSYNLLEHLKAMDASKLKFSYSRCNLVWKNRIGPTTFIDSDSSEIESFNQVMHRNVSEYVNLYP